ncbi:hypothetical protein EDC94DRAFT_510779 [Helicostylum pulchrum]|nr:hypothetical protein EDC94DRAFT_510779 [Helicostylum pulchrum]
MKKFNSITSSMSSSMNSPIPTSLAGECKKAAKILNSFVDPGQGMDKLIPAGIIEKAQGLAIYTVLKAGFLFSGRAGSGIVVAKWLECTIMYWNRWYWCWWSNWRRIDRFCTCFKYERSFAAGPIGRNAEASGSASLKHIAAIYSYSKTRGLFAGVSLEGSVVVTRGDANEKFYGQRVTAKQLLSGAIPPPPEADALYRALNAKFHTLGTQTYSPGADGTRSIGRIGGGSFKSTHISAPGTLKQPPPLRQIGGYGAPLAIQQQPYNPPSPPNYHQFNNTPTYSPPVSNASPAYTNQASPAYSNQYQPPAENKYASQAAAKRAPPPPPQSRKPGEQTAKALYAFDGQQQGDLSFQEGDVITIVQKTDSQDDWWTGKVNGQQGIFPANYVQLQ